MDSVLTETYFSWLASECFSIDSERREYEGVLRELHDIPFYWTMVSDDNRVGDALEFRQYEFLRFYEGAQDIDQMTLGQWATAAPSVLEVLLAMARRWTFYFEGSTAFYFGHLFRNLEMYHYVGRFLSTGTRNEIRQRVDIWLSRNFNPDGTGSPLPVGQQWDDVDFRRVDIWGQMNAYSAQHFQ
jgi:hypothetical protein